MLVGVVQVTCKDSVTIYFPVARHLKESNTAILAGKGAEKGIRFVVVNNNCDARVGAGPNG